MKQLWFETLPSTIEVAKHQLANGCEAGLIVVARTQTAGRGQFARRFDDVPGQALLYSQVLYPQAIPDDFAYRVGVSLVRFLTSHYALEGLEIKRPNDVYYAGRKLAGILIEPQYLGSELEGVIVSVGLNVFAIPPQQPQATCLAMIKVQPYDCHQLACELQSWFQAEFGGAIKNADLV